jgi:hypothetical protein
MNDLKAYLKENRKIFDDKEPPEGHFERFEKRLSNFVAAEKRKRNLKIRIITAISIAASILLVVGLRTGLRTFSGNDQDVAGEFSKAETFYRRQMDEQITAILCKLNEADAETRNQLEADLQHIAEDNQKFVAEIRNIPNEELSIYYLVEHYSDNVQTLQFINKKLSEYFKC